METIMPIVGNYLLPVSLWAIMLTMGMSLVPDDFRKIAANSRAFVVGTASMIFLVPLVGTAISLAFAPTPALAVGFILLATCPGGMLSNLLTDLAKGNLALSVSISLFVSVIYIFTLPFITLFALQLVLGNGTTVAIPFLSSLTHILGITVFPIAVGMVIRHIWPAFANSAGGGLKTVATVMLTVIFGLVVIDEFDTLRSSFGTVLAMVVGMNVANFLIAVGVSRLSKLKPADRISVAIEHLIRQEATAVYVAVSLLGRSDMSLPMIINTFVGMAACVTFVGWLKRRRSRESVVAAALAAVESIAVPTAGGMPDCGR
jgi:BASS family bile acid:Na+ symporter